MESILPIRNSTHGMFRWFVLAWHGMTIRNGCAPGCARSDKLVNSFVWKWFMDMCVCIIERTANAWHRYFCCCSFVGGAIGRRRFLATETERNRVRDGRSGSGEPFFFFFSFSRKLHAFNIYRAHEQEQKKKMVNYFSVAYNSIFHSANAVKYGEKK